MSRRACIASESFQFRHREDRSWSGAAAPLVPLPLFKKALNLGGFSQWWKMSSFGSSALNINVFALALSLSLLVLSVGWGYERREVESEFRAVSQARVKALAQTLAKLDKIPEHLEDLVARGTLKADDLKDGWGNDLVYDRQTHEAVSFGGDGLEGGEGFGKDIRLKVGSPSQ